MTESDDAKQLRNEVMKLMRDLYPIKQNKVFKMPLLIAVCYFLFYELFQLLIAVSFGVFSGNPEIHDFSEDYPNFFMGLFYAVMIFYHLWLPNLFTNTLVRLYENGAFEKSEVNLQSLIGISKNTWWIRVPIIGTIVLLMCWFVYMPLDSFNFWFEVNLIPFLAVTVLYSVAWYTGFALLITIVLAIRFMNLVFKDNHIRVNPLHPDECGGFRPLSTFSIRLINIALFWAVILVVSVIRSYQLGVIGGDYALFSSPVLYLMLVPTLFYLPLHSTHLAMLKYRNQLMADTAEQYLREHNTLLSELSASDKDMEARLKRLENLQKVQEHNRKYPVWPFTYRIRFAVLANAVIPTVTTIIGFILDYLN